MPWKDPIEHALETDKKILEIFKRSGIEWPEVEEDVELDEKTSEAFQIHQKISARSDNIWNTGQSTMPYAAKMSLIGPLPGEPTTTNQGQDIAFGMARALLPDITDPAEAAEYFVDLYSHAKVQGPVLGARTFAAKRLIKEIPAVKKLDNQLKGAVNNAVQNIRDRASGYIHGLTGDIGGTGAGWSTLSPNVKKQAKEVISSVKKPINKLTRKEYRELGYKLHVDSGIPTKNITEILGPWIDDLGGEFRLHSVKGKGVNVKSLNSKRLRNKRNAIAAIEQTGNLPNAYASGALKLGKDKVHHMRPKKVINTILTGSEGVERKALLSLAHDIYGGIGDTMGNLQRLPDNLHNEVHRRLAKAGVEKLDPKTFEKMSNIQRVEFMFKLREEVLKINKFVFDSKMTIQHGSKWRPK